MSLLRQPILLLARSQGVKRLVSTMPVSSGIVTGYVPGETTADAVRATQGLVDDGLRVTLDYLGEDTTDAAQAEATVVAYKELLADLASRGLAPHAEVSVKLSAIGQFLPDNGHKVALENARDICRALHCPRLGVRPLIRNDGARASARCAAGANAAKRRFAR